MTPAHRLLAGLTLSLGVHAGIAALAPLVMGPEPIEPQARAQSKLRIETQSLARSDAAQVQPDSAAAKAESTAGQAINTGAIRQSRAAPVLVPAQPLADQHPGPVHLSQSLPDAQMVAAAVPAGQKTVAAAAIVTPMRPNPPTAPVLAAQAAVVLTARPVAPAPNAVGASAVAAVAAQPASAVQPDAVAAIDAQPQAVTLIASRARLNPNMAATGLTLPAGAPQPQTALALDARPLRVATVAKPSQPAPSPASDLPIVLASAPQIKQITASAGEKQRLTGALLPAAPAVAAPDTGELFQPVATEAAVLPDGPASAVELTAVNPPANLIPRTQPETVHATAALAFSGVADSELDETALATIEFFMAAGDASSRAIQSRDALQGLLASVPCARLQAEFNPDTGSIDLHGHVPDAGLRTPLIEALKAQIGAGITINDAMLILPRPQCGALSGIATVGLPQSTDQFTNRRLLGADTQTRSYDYGSGAQLVLDLAAPDYDAFIYVDFFDADGQVIHLAPNDRVPLRLRKAGSTVQVGTEAAGEPYLDITIGPPYGQEIAAAFAASRRLYDGVRPMREPAVEYLDWLGQQVTRVRAQDPGFKGEWVYFFISTHE